MNNARGYEKASEIAPTNAAKTASPLIIAQSPHQSDGDGDLAVTQQAQQPLSPRRRAVKPALPSFARPLIRPTAVPRTYRVLSSSRAGLLHTANLTNRTCDCEDFIYSDRESYPADHELRACRHIRDCEIYEREQVEAGRPILQAGQDLGAWASELLGCGTATGGTR